MNNELEITLKKRLVKQFKTLLAICLERLGRVNTQKRLPVSRQEFEMPTSGLKVIHLRVLANFPLQVVFLSFLPLIVVNNFLLSPKYLNRDHIWHVSWYTSTQCPLSAVTVSLALLLCKKTQNRWPRPHCLRRIMASSIRALSFISIFVALCKQRLWDGSVIQPRGP
jgi:hypothetical protein